MENSLRQDYISEKIWDGLRSGCIPVYLGSNSVRDVVPDPGSFVMFDPSGGGDASTPEELDALLHQIGSDRQRYESMTAWRYRKVGRLRFDLFAAASDAARVAWPGCCLAAE